MNNTKPLTYDSLRTVLQHTDANLRFRLVSHIPSIRAAEKSSPLKIERFVYRRRSISINQMCYLLSLYKKRKFGMPSEDDEMMNKLGKCHRDVDKYGFRFWANEVLFPGDVVFMENHRALRDLNHGPQGYEEIPRLEERLKTKQKRMDKLRSMDATVVPESPIRGFQRQYRQFDDQRLYRDYLEIFRNQEHIRKVNKRQMRKLEVRGALEDVINELQGKIRELEDELAPYYCKRDNTEPLHEIYIQIIAFNENHSSELDKAIIERLEYTKKLYEVEKYFCDWVFGKRKQIVHVKRFEFSELAILRLPPGLRLKIRELNFTGNIVNIFNGLKQILEDSSYPLEALKITGFGQVSQDFEHSLVQSAKRLTIGELLPEETRWLPIYLKLRNARVHKVCQNVGFPIEDHIRLVKNWLEVGREIGTRYTFQFRFEESVKDLLKLAKEQCEGAVSSGNCVTIPMNSTSELKITYEENPEDMFNDEKSEGHYWVLNPPWVVKFAVVSIKSSD